MGALRARGAIGPAGPLLPVRIGNIPNWQQMLDPAVDSALPRPVDGLALVDTGATVSVVIPRVADQLRACPAPAMQLHGLHPTQQWATAASSVVRAAYVQVELPGTGFRAVVHCPCLPLGAALSTPDLVMILGRDVLSRVRLNWDGPGGTFEVEPA